METMPAVRRQKSTLLLLPSLALALAPKCPACLLAYVGVVGSMSASSVYSAWLAPVTAVSLALAVSGLAVQAWTVRRLGPVLLALLAVFGAVSIFAGRFTLHQKSFVYAGMAALAAAALRSSAWHARHAREACERCSER